MGKIYSEDSLFFFFLWKYLLYWLTKNTAVIYFDLDSRNRGGSVRIRRVLCAVWNTAVLWLGPVGIWKRKCYNELFRHDARNCVDLWSWERFLKGIVHQKLKMLSSCSILSLIKYFKVWEWAKGIFTGNIFHLIFGWTIPKLQFGCSYSVQKNATPFDVPSRFHL